MDSPPSEFSGRYFYNPTLRWNRQVEEYFINAYGADHFARISRALTHPSSYSCVRVNFLRSTRDVVIEKLTSILNGINFRSSPDLTCMGRNSATAEVDHEIQLPSSNGLPRDGDIFKKHLSIDKCQLPGLDYVFFVKGSGPHVMQCRDFLVQPLKEVIVSRKCAEAVLRGAQVFVPGVLACSSHVEKGDVVAVSVAVEQPRPDGEWGVGITRGTVLQGLQSDPHYHERNGLYIGQGVAMMSRAGIFRVSEGTAVEMSNRIYNLPSFHDILKGEIFLQNLPSIITAHALDPHEGERILDMCAAPGGKTTAIATLMRDRGEVIALDRSHNKVIAIVKLAEEMGLTCIRAYKLDARKSVQKKDSTEVPSTNSRTEISCNNVDDSKLMGNERYNTGLTITECEGDREPSQGPYSGEIGIRKSSKLRNGRGRSNSGGGRVKCSSGFLPSSFDRVLLDAPCSALGLRPRLFAGEETMETLRNHAKYQRTMFDQAVQLVRSGGVVVYSTCTINPGENEALVRYALDTYKFLSLAPQHPRIGGPGLVGGCELFNGKFTEDWLTEAESELVQRFDPSSSLDTIGFFIAKFSVGRKDT
ncbi:unnamed protein product [Spirodela intermedia]|uniref:SAM-dependent MTase RsmB/NOP-type domain-containing protein n=1 Tax=Spirodela intermedia TaxID=51605 RepID=A0A7I8KXF0_SPIIN|nr:unnamed protein product [Spirodela intermedia]